MRGCLVVCLVTLFACGGRPPIPKRGVVEADLGAWKFRRYQAVRDLEIWVENNKAEAYTASYVAESAEKRGHVEDKDVVSVFVTRYDHAAGVLRETVKFARRLGSESGYQVDEDKIAGARVLTITGRGESWVLWASKQHVIKVGGRGRDDVPKSVVESYADRYPSKIPGGALEGPLPAGPDNQEPKEETQDYDPSNPRPDLEQYDPKKTKLPAKK